ncbi:MAG: hypothetical protein ACI85I_000444 [Arenicella sp.]|jgi:hypothetical protein
MKSISKKYSQKITHNYKQVFLISWRKHPLVPLFKTFGVLAILLISLSTNSFAQKARLEKTISEKYTVSKSDKLLIDNRFGEVVIRTWDKKEITVDITIEGYGKNENQAKEMLNKVEIDYGKSGGEISFITRIDKKNNSWSNNGKSGYEINYVVNMPKSNPLDLTNKYGSTQLDDFDGKLKLVIGYGKINAGNLGSNEVDILVKYSKATFKDISGGKLELRYSGGTSIGKVGTIELSDKYGGVSIEEAESVDAEIAYSSLKVQTLAKELKLDSRYSGCKIYEVQEGFESVDVSTSFGSCTIGFQPNADFDFYATAKFGGFKNSLSNTDIRKEISKNNSTEVEGTHGKSGKAKVRVSASFGSIIFE